MSPQTGSRRYTHTQMKWFMGTSVFSKFPLRDFSFFFSSRAQKTQKLKQANKLLFSAQMFFKYIFNFCPLFAFLCFWLVAFLCFWYFSILLVLFCAFWCFWCFSPVRNFFVKKKFKTALITSIILLLNPSTALFLL